MQIAIYVRIVSEHQYVHLTCAIDVVLNPAIVLCPCVSDYAVLKLAS